MPPADVASATSEIRIELIQLSDYRFEARFDMRPSAVCILGR